MCDSFKRVRGPKPKKQNPISSAIENWAHKLEPSSSEATGANSDEDLVASLVAQGPKRYVEYQPLILLPSGSFTTPAWVDLFGRVDAGLVLELWDAILRDVSKGANTRLTHLAVNDGIPPLARDAGGRNLLRSPTGLRMLLGDFGPAAPPGEPTEEDFGQAFWVSTKQNGIVQTWAPRWTMFSRGNVTEKARLLQFHSCDGRSNSPAAETPRASGQGDLSHRRKAEGDIRDKWAIDLYAGIGYFVFSYAKLGMKVLCWELNPWSVEGLRRGAVCNGWTVKVVKRADLRLSMAEIMASGERIVVFLEDNAEAAGRIEELRSRGQAPDVLHVNCGLLPKSDGSWRGALGMVGEAGDAWLHLHENVAVSDVDSRRDEIQAQFGRWINDGDAHQTAQIDHVEPVKSYAPGVRHCVFDLWVTREP